MPRILALASLICMLSIASRFLLGQGHSPSESLQSMTTLPGFEVQLVANEPLVRQPVCIEFDDRGRMWVIQYLQYPNPAGLERVEVDRYSRTKYDRIPAPPPRGPRGSDRITILEDKDGDGKFESGRDFVDRLNLATGLAFGHRGVFVLNVPYLLFYPDANRDDVPDSDPQVLLTGFGMQDAHSVANSLTWGPDGWLYGCQGSTVTSNIRGIEFQQGVWRYHPTTQRFELFCEGGGNAWGLDFDRQGKLFYSTNYGGFVMVHGVQGAYYVKSFSKHGALHNPHAYGYFDHVPHADFQGGHVTVGGIVYQADAFPESFRGKYIAGDLLGHGVYWHDIETDGSTIRTKHGGKLMTSSDPWFAPTDLTVGPDGAIYVSDWCDARTAHPDPDADWDRSNGRVYRIAPRGLKQPTPFDFAKMSIAELSSLLGNANQWWVRHARSELVRRNDPKVIPFFIESSLFASKEQTALESLWTLQSLNSLDEPLAIKLLDSPHASVREWTVRWLGDQPAIEHGTAELLDDVAEREQSIDVRQQLACTAARLPAEQALPIINANINRDIDNQDPYLPLLWWWAVERHAMSDREQVLSRFTRHTLWNSKLGRDFLLPRLVRRYASEKRPAGFDSLVRLVRAAQKQTDVVEHMASLWQAIRDGRRESSKREWKNDPSALESEEELAGLVFEAWQANSGNLDLTYLAIDFGFREVYDATFVKAFNDASAEVERTEAIRLLSEFPDERLLQPLADLLRSDMSQTIRLAALQGLTKIDDGSIAEILLSTYPNSKDDSFKTAIRDKMLSRADTAGALLNAVDQGRLSASEIPIEEIRRVALFEDDQMNALVTKHWGRLTANSPEEKLAEVRRLNNDLRAGDGIVESGKAIFKLHCASCHQLFGEGTKLGPDLTLANRQDRDFLLISLVDPNSVIRKEYVNMIVQTTDGRVITGLMRSSDESKMVIVNAKNEATEIATSEIEQFRESPVSLMPEDLYKKLSPQELRDLIAYLQNPSQ